MTKILVFSDLHYASEPLRKALISHPEARYAIFLGDGLRNFRDVIKDFPDLTVSFVRGNCDISVDHETLGAPTVQSASYENVRVFFCHGHTLGVKTELGISALLAHAKHNGADIALFGHTHVPFHEEYDVGNGKKISVFNPGSIGEPHAGHDFSYGILTVSDGSFKLSHETVKKIG